MSTVKQSDSTSTRLDYLTRARRLLMQIPVEEAAQPMLVQQEKTRIAMHFLTSRLEVGRETSDGLNFADDEMSGRHFELLPEDGDWVAADLGSKNGLWINGSQVERRKLVHGDFILAGSQEFVFHDGKPAEDLDADDP